METSLSRRTLLGAISIGTLSLAGCLWGDDEYRLDPDDFEDEYLHLVAEGLVREDLELVSITRVEGWIEASVTTDVELDWYFGPDTPSFIEDAIEEGHDVSDFRQAPGAETIIEWYIDAVEAGEAGEGLRVEYADGTCTGITSIPRNRADWVLNETLDRRSVIGEFSNTRYSVDCSN